MSNSVANIDQPARTINTFSRPLPVRENPDVLLRSISTVPVLEGDARSLAVALGYAEFVLKTMIRLYFLYLD